jgi:diaminobutyrate-2-oxoglutarate transaminase
MNLTTFDQLESRVRHYVHSFPTIFSKAKGAQLWDENDRCYIDFFSGAGVLNYGHNNRQLQEKLIEYIEADGVVLSLDMANTAKGNFLQAFESVVLKPRNMKYIMQFTGPTGANAVEAALKLARKVKQRSNVIAFTNAFHGVSMGALSATANAHFRGAAGVDLGNVTFMPYDGYFGPGVNTIDYLARMIDDRGSGIDTPAAVIVETIQGEGGVRVASSSWLRELEKVCRRHDMLLIVDEIQVGCGRTGRFFSFEEAGIQPDIITLSKSLSAYGLPMAMVLMKPELDQWQPSEHNGTFRGNNLAFVTGAHALQCYWKNDELAESVRRKGELIQEWFERMASNHPEVGMRFRGRGLIWGLSITDVHSVTLKRVRNRPEQNIHRRIARHAFENGLIIEPTGAYDDVLKMLPPLVIEESLLRQGLEILESSIEQSLHQPLGVVVEEATPFPELMHT